MANNSQLPVVWPSVKADNAQLPSARTDLTTTMAYSGSSEDNQPSNPRATDPLGSPHRATGHRRGKRSAPVFRDTVVLLSGCTIRCCESAEKVFFSPDFPLSAGEIETDLGSNIFLNPHFSKTDGTFSAVSKSNQFATSW